MSMIEVTVLLVMFCVVLAFTLVGIDPTDNLPEVRRKLARLFRRRDKMTTDWLIETMRRYDVVLRRAKDVLERRGIKCVDCVDEVILRGNEVVIKFTFKWDWEHVKDSVAVPFDKFIGD